MKFEQLDMFSQEPEKSLTKHQFEHLRKQANAVRVRENLIYEDYKNGLTIRDISSKYHCVGSYVTAVIKYLGKQIQGGEDD